ncbi:9125_t:CDS:1, partial [Funneliformis caledonium]
ISRKSSSYFSKTKMPHKQARIGSQKFISGCSNHEKRSGSDSPHEK